MKSKIYKFHCEFLVRAKSKEKAEEYAKEEFGEAYEPHIIVNEIEDNGMDIIDIDLTK
jgi:hypothetical protein